MKDGATKVEDRAGKNELFEVFFFFFSSLARSLARSPARGLTPSPRWLLSRGVEKIVSPLVSAARLPSHPLFYRHFPQVTMRTLTRALVSCLLLT